MGMLWLTQGNSRESAAAFVAVGEQKGAGTRWWASQSIWVVWRLPVAVPSARCDRDRRLTARIILRWPRPGSYRGLWTWKPFCWDISSQSLPALNAPPAASGLNGVLMMIRHVRRSLPEN